MDSQVAICLIVFIVVIAALCICKNLQQGMLLAVTVTNIFAVYSHLKKNVAKKKNQPTDSKPTENPSRSSEEIGTLREIPAEDPALMPFYGVAETEVNDLPDREEEGMNIRKYGQYRGGYADSADRVRAAIQFHPADPNEKIIEMNKVHSDRARMAQVGAATKTSDYYKYHFGDEFEGEEKKEWWGQKEYEVEEELPTSD